MIRVLAEHPLGAAAQQVLLSADERHHLKVRRVEPGAPVEVLDGMGRVGRGILSATGQVDITDVAIVEPLQPVILLVGAGDKERFGWLVEKAVEVGVSEIVPIDTERSVQVATRLRPSHVDKLARRVDEALKQCGGAWRTVVRRPTPIREAMESCPAGDRWLADPAGPPPRVAGTAQSVAVVVGPEGGLTDAEIRAASQLGFTPTTFGVRTMRFETAALAAAVIARHRGLLP